MTRALLALILILAPGCARFLTIDEATVTMLEPDAGSGARDAATGAKTDDARVRHPPPDASDASGDDVVPVTSDAGIIDCFDGRCAGGVICPATQSCIVRCRGAGACPSVTCATGQPCIIDCEEGACAEVMLRAATATAACMRCGSCDHKLFPSDNTLGCRVPAPACTSTDSCGI